MKTQHMAVSALLSIALAWTGQSVAQESQLEQAMSDWQAETARDIQYNAGLALAQLGELTRQQVGLRIHRQAESSFAQLSMQPTLEETLDPSRTMTVRYLEEAAKQPVCTVC